MGFITLKKREWIKKKVAGVLAGVIFLSSTILQIPVGASNIWPQKSTDPYYCMDGGKPWRSTDRYAQVSRQEAGISDTQARRLFWAYPSIWNGYLKPAAAKYDTELYNEIKGTSSDPNTVKRVKDDASTKFAWVADNPDIEERAKSAIVKYVTETLTPGMTPPDAMFNQETGTYAVYENAAIRIPVGAFEPGFMDGQTFEIDEYFISKIKNIEPQTVYDNGSTGGTEGWIDASQDKNIATSVLGTKLYEISWSGSSLRIINNGSQYANETILDQNVPEAVKYNKTVVRYKITMRENSGYVLEAEWNENYLDEWMWFKICTNTSNRQRLYFANIMMTQEPMPFYIEVYQSSGASVPTPPTEETPWQVPFEIYRHEETFESDYNVRLKKLDSETGYPVKGSQFYLFERFDSGDSLSDTQKDGGLTEDNLSFEPWEDFEIFAEATTNSDGEIEHTDHREYEYSKTYCNGHPAPEWAAIPEEQKDEITGETMNQRDIQNALDKNQTAAKNWLKLVDECTALMEDSDTHFHWLADESMYNQIASAADSGTPVNFEKKDVSMEKAFEESGCRNDCEKTYENFINLEFSYTWKEIQASNGYILHGLHPEDQPIEIITTNSSQAGAKSRFGNGYSSEIENDRWYTENGGGIAEKKRSYRKEKQALYDGAPREAQVLIHLSEEPNRLVETAKRYKTSLFFLRLARSASASDARRTGSNAVEISLASSSDADAEGKAQNTLRADFADDSWENDGGNAESFNSYMETATADGIEHLSRGEADCYSHCNGADSCGDSWRVYDHRTEGRLHINKRDLELYKKESKEYSAYGDTEGDATLEGAVYGLFAAENILHPDSQIAEDGTVENTGIVYKQNDLVAVAATDKAGNADFIAFTEAPGCTYDYEKGKIIQTETLGAKNLYQNTGFQEERDEYSGDDLGGLHYQNNEKQNGNCWIGRPLILGNYYIKELTRSEGYELSVNGISREETNRGTGFETPASISSSLGTAVLSIPELSAAMEGEDGSGNGYDQFPFSVTSSGTVNAAAGTDGYDLIFSGFPEGTKFYREDSGEEEVTGPHVTGFEETEVRDENGEIVWKRAESDESDLRYEPIFDSTGKLAGQRAVTQIEEQVMRAEQIPQVILMSMEDTELGSEPELTERLSDYEISEESDPLFLFAKARTEEILRRNGYDTPKKADGTYSTPEHPSYSRGVRKGEIDSWGQTTEAGKLAVRTVYGEEIVVLELSSIPPAATCADLIAAILSWYDEHPEWNFGGIDKIEETDFGYQASIYAGVSTISKKRFFTIKKDEEELEVDKIYVAYENPETMRYFYQEYSNTGEYAYELEQKYTSGSGASRRYYVDAVVKPALQAGTSGKLEKIYHTVMVYHRKGEEIVDYESGDPDHGYRVPLTEKKEKIEITTEIEQVQTDVELPAEYDEKTGIYTVHVEAQGTDSYGKEFTDENGSLKLSFIAVTEQKKTELSESDIEAIGNANVFGYQPGDEIGYVQYLMRFGNAAVNVSVSAGTDADDTYIVTKRLIYRGQDKVSEDGDTLETPVQVLERPIRQKVKVVKDIQTTEEGAYQDNSYQIHEDAFTSDFGGFLNGRSAKAIPNFRFRIYLKSNLERLYRNAAGEVVWVDREGETVDIEEYRNGFPELVQKIYTKIPDDNNRLLETVQIRVEDEEDGYYLAEQYNYEKFFDAIKTADTDKWRKEGPVINSSFKPFAGSRITGAENTINSSEAARENAKRSDAVRQFAVDWYLDEEVSKLVRIDSDGELQAEDGAAVYSDELYDRALYAAIQKAENYLKPFFAYDINQIYAVAWDSELDGGIDGDKTTLSADSIFSEDGEPVYSYGISNVLPYGDYVLVEQQPWNPDWKDFSNKHYAVDAPKEISVPVAYEGGLEGARKTPEEENSYYCYRKEDTPEDLAEKYYIRFNEEMAENHTDDARSYIIHAHNSDGDFEIYKYGLDRDQADGHYEPYGNAKVSAYYHYDSASEHAGIAGPANAATNHQDEKEQTATMTGVRTAYDGKFASMLIPWSMTEPENEEADCTQSPDGASSYAGYAYRKMRNTFYSVKLRVEKLDAETGEQILHDDAIFALYAAERDDSSEGDGTVLRYNEPTLLTGSRLFLEAMGAENIVPLAREWDSKGEPGTTCYGTVPAGTPICTEKEGILLKDSRGIQRGTFEALATVRDGSMKADAETGLEKGLQTTGYLETPQPIGAGVYVLAEIKAPEGYVKSRPIPIEVYSDEVAYYLNGGEEKTAAIVYAYPADEVSAENSEEKAEDNRPEDSADTARIYVNDTAVRLQVSKVKTTDTIRKMKISGRVEGSLTELSGKYGLENLELAYNHSGSYLGYGWLKGTLEYLENRKAAGEAVEIVYNEHQIFTGYGYITRELDTADDENRYVAGAVMALYEAIELKPSGDSEDYAYEGVEISRDRNGNVKSIYIKEGYAGERTELVEMEGGNWTYKTILRKDTPVLFYDLGGLKVTEQGTGGSVYGYDRDGNKIQITSDTKSIYAVQNGASTFEITGGNLSEVSYDAASKTLDLADAETKIYHLDEKKNRDAQIDGYTGLAYIEENGKKYAWPITVYEDSSGNVIFRHKILTGRPAEENADTENAYITGSMQKGEFLKELEPVYDVHGLVRYYLRSPEAYEKGEPVYDRDGDYICYQYEDLLEGYNRAAYQIEEHDSLFDIGEPENPEDDVLLWRRKGESALIPNVWITGEKAPNASADSEMTYGHPDMLKRVYPGVYIMEEIFVPEGYVRALPAVVPVEETAEIQKISVMDEKTKIEILKTDGTDQYGTEIINYDDSDFGESISREGKGAYTHQLISGAELALFRAKRVYTSDYETYPKGYYLEKTEDSPATWYAEDPKDNHPVKVTARWTTDGRAKYFEGIPAGDYILEELYAPEGYLKNAMELTVEETEELQSFVLKDDHTKLEIYKYERDENGSKVPLPDNRRAELTLYPAVLDSEGQPELANGLPLFDEEKIMDQWETGDISKYQKTYELPEQGWWEAVARLFTGTPVSGFTYEYEKLFMEYGADFQTFAWQTEENGIPKEHRAALLDSRATSANETVTQIWKLDGDEQIRITVCQAAETPVFEYQFHFRALENGMVSYDTSSGIHRIDRIPQGFYVLVETETPAGYQTPEPKLIEVTETRAVQRYELENKGKETWIDKIDENGEQLKGAEFILYRAAEDGSLMEKDSYEAARWISGSEGRFTGDDISNGKAPEGYQEGDLKPHRLKDLSFGTYYLTETQAPKFYAKMKPQKIEIDADSNPVIKAVNRISEGRLILKKEDKETGIPLMGAEFELKNLETGQTWSLITDEKGLAKSPALPVGELENGEIKPYSYHVKEIQAPDHYQINQEEWTFSFEEDQTEEVLTYTLNVSDRETELTFRKTDFDTGVLVKGAILAIYGTREEDGQYKKDGAAITSWISDGKPHMVKGLIAGRTYFLEEVVPPEGYAAAAPILFTVSSDGTSITEISDEPALIHYEGTENGGIGSVTIRGRAGKHLLYTLYHEGETVISWIGSGNGREFSGGELEDGEVYTLTETAVFSDGSTLAVRSETFRAVFSGDIFKIPDRRFTGTRLTVADEDGQVIASWIPEPDRPSHTIQNPMAEEEKALRVTSQNGRNGQAAYPGQAITYEILCKNEEKTGQTMRIKATLGPGLEYMSSAGGIENEDSIIWNVFIPAGDKQIVTLTAAVQKDAAEPLTLSVEFSEEKTEELTTPVALEGSLTISNHLEGTGSQKGEETEFTYKIMAAGPDGEELPGLYSYFGSKSGELRGNDEISLRGDEFITITGLPWGSFYEIIQEEASGFSLEEARKTGITGKEGKTAVFFNRRDDGSRRQVFEAGKRYSLEEISYFGETAQITGTVEFSLNQAGVVTNVNMKDKMTRTEITKEDLTKGEELPGAFLTLKKEDGTVVEEWISGQEPHIIRSGLKPGETYVLEEIFPPDGYGYAEAIAFTAALDGSIQRIRMSDRPTRIEIEKTDITDGKNLSGAKLVLEDSSGNIVDEWITEKEPHILCGKLTAGAVYTLKEVSPPSGYGWTEEVSFQVALDGSIQKIKMEDQPTRVEIQKIDIATGKELPGARMTIKDMSGKIVEEWISGEEPHILVGKLEAGKRYVLSEDGAPAGYWYSESVEFEVSEDGAVDRVIMEDSPTEIQIEKRDGESGKLLSGARLRLEDSGGRLIEEWMSEAAPHILKGKLNAGETYLLKEVKAPAGYEKADDFKFTVSDYDTNMEIIMNDFRIPKKEEPDEPKEPDRPDQPDQPAEPRKGRITARYTKEWRGIGTAVVDNMPEERFRIPKTGDDWRPEQYEFLMVISILGIVLLKRKKQKGGE